MAPQVCKLLTEGEERGVFWEWGVRGYTTVPTVPGTEGDVQCACNSLPPLQAPPPSERRAIIDREAIETPSTSWRRSLCKAKAIIGIGRKMDTIGCFFLAIEIY